jgi:hypothetical protein
MGFLTQNIDLRNKIKGFQIREQRERNREKEQTEERKNCLSKYIINKTKGDGAGHSGRAV